MRNHRRSHGMPVAGRAAASLALVVAVVVMVAAAATPAAPGATRFSVKPGTYVSAQRDLLLVTPVARRSVTVLSFGCVMRLGGQTNIFGVELPAAARRLRISVTGAFSYSGPATVRDPAGFLGTTSTTYPVQVRLRGRFSGARAEVRHTFELGQTPACRSPRQFVAKRNR